MPKEGVVHHNLGTALLRLAQARGNDRALLEEAAESLRQAVALGGRRAPHFYVRLAEALNALGDRAGAEAALRQAFAVNPADPVLMMARVSSLADVSGARRSANACKAVDFGCKKGCPHGITGRIMMVACEIANADAVSACRDGKPYPKGYQLREQDAALRNLHSRSRPRILDHDALGFDRRHRAGRRPGRLAEPASIPPPVAGRPGVHGRPKAANNPSTGAANWSFSDGGVQLRLVQQQCGGAERQRIRPRGLRCHPL